MNDIIVYWTGFIAVWILAYGWNYFTQRDIDKHIETHCRRPDDIGKIDMGWAFLASIFSWFAIATLIFIMILGTMMYYATESDLAKKINKAFKVEK